MIPALSSRRRAVSPFTILPVAVLLSAACSLANAQSPPTAEFPVLVVDHQHRPVEDFKASQFSIRTGTGEAFAPLSMRKEGVDPVSFVVLLDASRDSWHDLAQIGDDLAALAGPVLLPTDRLSVYAVDCKTTRSLLGASPDPATVRKAVTDALDAPTLHDGKKGPECAKTVHLWDDVAVAVAELAKAPGRRVLLIVSGGIDGASKYDWKTVHQYAFDNGVAIFALRDQRLADADDFSRNALSTRHGFNGPSMNPTPTPRGAEAIELLCANTGGLTLTANPLFRKDALADIVFLVRSRFIFTVPREAVASGNAENIKVTLPANPYFISTTGVTPALR